MKKILFAKVLLGSALLLGGAARAQTGGPAAGPGPGFNARALFAPNFLDQAGPATHTAGGQPGATYWQNAADYQIAASLDEKRARVTATAAIT